MCGIVGMSVLQTHYKHTLLFHFFIGSFFYITRKCSSKKKKSPTSDFRKTKKVRRKRCLCWV
jgi:hypothetical protein